MVCPNQKKKTPTTKKRGGKIEIWGRRTIPKSHDSNLSLYSSREKKKRALCSLGGKKTQECEEGGDCSVQGRKSGSKK